jgi:hypothetical protein
MKKAQLRKIIRESIKKDLLEINPLNEVQCPCFADKHMSAGSEPLMCTNSTGNVVNVTGCCGSGAGSADAPVHALCNGKTCDNLDYNSPGCWDNIHKEKEKKTQIAHTNANPQQTGFPRPTSQIEPSIDKMMREAAKEIVCEQSDQDSGEVTTFTITSTNKNGERGKTIKANRNHKVIRNLDITNATKVNQLTKGQDSSKEDRLNEGKLCCWLRGGCCKWEKNYPDPHTSWNPDDHVYEHWAGYVIEWNGCCGNSSKGGCC